MTRDFPGTRIAVCEARGSRLAGRVTRDSWGARIARKESRGSRFSWHKTRRKGGTRIAILLARGSRLAGPATRGSWGARIARKEARGSRFRRRAARGLRGPRLAAFGAQDSRFMGPANRGLRGARIARKEAALEVAIPFGGAVTILLPAAIGVIMGLICAYARIPVIQGLAMNFLLNGMLCPLQGGKAVLCAGKACEKKININGGKNEKISSISFGIGACFRLGCLLEWRRRGRP